jgi:hypothetical protein
VAAELDGRGAPLRLSSGAVAPARCRTHWPRSHGGDAAGHWWHQLELDHHDCGISTLTVISPALLSWHLSLMVGSTPPPAAP